MVKNKIQIIYMHAYGLNIEQCGRTYNGFYNQGFVGSNSTIESTQHYVALFSLTKAGRSVGLSWFITCVRCLIT